MSKTPSQHDATRNARLRRTALSPAPNTPQITTETRTTPAICSVSRGSTEDPLRPRQTRRVFPTARPRQASSCDRQGHTARLLASERAVRPTQRPRKARRRQSSRPRQRQRPQGQGRLRPTERASGEIRVESGNRCQDGSDSTGNPVHPPNVAGSHANTDSPAGTESSKSGRQLASPGQAAIKSHMVPSQ